MAAADSSAPFRAGLAALQASRSPTASTSWPRPQADLATARTNAERAAQRADQRKTDAATQLAQLQQALGQQQQVVRPGRRPARRRPWPKPPRLEPDRRQAGRADPGAAGRRRRPAPGAPARRPQAAAARSGISLPLPGRGRSVGSPIGTIAVTTVGGITVNVSIAGQVAALLRDAAAGRHHPRGRRLPQRRRPDRRAPQQLRPHASTTSTRSLRRNAGRRQPGLVSRCTSRAWPSTSPATGR